MIYEKPTWYQAWDHRLHERHNIFKTLWTESGFWVTKGYFTDPGEVDFLALPRNWFAI